MLEDNANREVDSFRREPAQTGRTLAVPEADPERIAFKLWNEGRVDEAIQFLESEIAAKRERYRRPTGEDQAQHLVRHDGSAAMSVEPVSDWRDRHRALSSADFNAFGATVRTIDITAGPADAIVPHAPRRSARAAWIMGLCLVGVLGASAGAALWSGRDDADNAAHPTARVEPPMVAPAAKPEAVVVAAEAPNVELAASSAADDTAAAPPPEDEMALEEPDPDTAVTAPETTASIDPPPAAEPPAIVEARLPRPRVEPPAEEPRVAPLAEADPLIVYAPETPPSYVPPRATRFFDPINPPPTLTPAEYQVLMERRAFAEDYAARRRAFAERRAMSEGGPIYFSLRRP